MSSAQDFPGHLRAYFPALKAVAIGSSLFNAGTMTTSYRLLPAIYPAVQKSCKDATKQWKFFYDTLYQTVPRTDLITIIICSGFAYIEHKENRAGLPWKLWATAAGIMPIGWLFVLTQMYAPSDKLKAIAEPEDEEHAKEKKDSQPEQRKTLNLLKEFNGKMGVRMLWPWAVGSLALWASLV